MVLTAQDKGGSGDFKLIPVGTHMARNNMIVDLGVQETTYMGAPKLKHQVYLRWEVADERISYKDTEGNPQEGAMTIGRHFTMSLNKKAHLRSMLEAWRGKSFTSDELAGFDITAVGGVAAMLTIVHTTDTDPVYANIASVAAVPKGLPVVGLENKLIVFDSDNPHNLADLPEWLQEKFAKRVVPTATQDTMPLDPPAPIDDEIPF